MHWAFSFSLQDIIPTPWEPGFVLRGFFLFVTPHSFLLRWFFLFFSFFLLLSIDSFSLLSLVRRFCWLAAGTLLFGIGSDLSHSTHCISVTCSLDSYLSALSLSSMSRLSNPCHAPMRRRYIDRQPSGAMGPVR